MGSHYFESATKTPMDHVGEIEQFIQSFSAQVHARTCRSQFGQDISSCDGCNSTTICFSLYEIKHIVSKLLGDSVTKLQCKTSAYTGRSCLGDTRLPVGLIAAYYSMVKFYLLCNNIT